MNDRDQTKLILFMNSTSASSTPMHPSSLAIPGLLNLAIIDPVLSRAKKIGLFSLVAAAGIYWVAQPVPTAVKVEISPIEVWVMQWGPAAALGVAVLSLLVLLRRYAWLKEILSHGTLIKGTVAEVTIYEREAPKSDNAPAFGGAKIRSYFTIIRYAWQGVEKDIRFKLPFSPSTYQLSKGSEVELILLESSPQKPLIRKVYLGGVMPRSRFFW